MSTPWVPSPDDNVVHLRPPAYDDGARPLGASDAVPVRPSALAGGPAGGGLAWGGPAVGHPVVGGPAVRTGSADASAARHREDSWRRGSATSFGLVGRLVITAALLAILVLIAVGNLLGVPVYLAFLVWAMRDLWVRPRRRSPSPTVARHAGTEDAAWTRERRPIIPRDEEPPSSA